MSLTPITIHAGDAPDVEAFLTERIVEFNARATGYFDAAAFSATQQDEEGVIRAGISGYTWGGCCYVSYLWIDERERGRGLGSALLLAAEEHARAKRCVMMLLSSHSFQAPGFYERHGYERQAVIHDHPVGYTSVFLTKCLVAA
jgi:ribosomal protein S18 acetylase RimI-like enzyme